MEPTYTEQELEAAKAYLKDRLRNERSMSSDVLRLLEVYAGYLLSALHDNASDEDIELLIQDLIQQLMDDAQTLAIDEHDNEDKILAYMLGERAGDTLQGRVEKRVRTFYNEVAAVYVAGKLLGKGQDAMLKSIKDSLREPWQNPLLVEAIEKAEKGSITIPDGVDFSERHYGKGEPISSLTALDRMLTYSIADAWMCWRHTDAEKQGAKGYYVVRGSSYPCPHCQDAADAGFHEMSDTEHIVPLHMNCVCYMIYSYVSRA